MTDPTKSVVDEFLALDEKRTPGEWGHPGEFVDNPLDSNRVFASGRDGSILETHGDSYEAIVNAAFCAAASRLAPSLRSLTGEVERLRAAEQNAYAMLELLGVPKERAKSISNGIDVLATRYRKGEHCDRQEIADLRAQLAACQQDARRYRWLRKTRSTMLIVSFFGSGCVNKTIEQVEARIDAALSGAKDNGHN